MISPSLANLSFLHRISLPNNQLHGHIPQELGLLSRLQHLNLTHNSIEGDVPESLSQCPNLQWLVMWDNKLQGEIPSNLSRCSELRDIDLSVNNLVGEIPPGLGSLRNLTELILYGNNLTGVIPPSLGNLTNLLILDLSENRLRGGIPPSLGKLSTVIHLNLDQNPLAGGIPPTFGNLSAVSVLLMSDNNLTGPIPSQLWNLPSLTVLQVDDNQLSGTLQPGMAHSPPRLQYLFLYQNQLHGSIPTWLSNSSELIKIQAFHNKFSGTIPTSIGSLKSLTELSFIGNQLGEGEATDWSFLTALSNCTNLQSLQLDVNLFGGTLPNSIGNLSTTMMRLTMQQNQMYGRIHEEIGNLINLTVLDMSRNFFQGAIPSTLWNLREIIDINLRVNNLSGEISPRIGNHTQLVELYLALNDLHGSIPTNLGNCQHLEVLDLEYNKLTGTIPKEIFTIITLSKGLSFAHNLLTGSLPLEVGSLKNLNALDVSANKLSGKIPNTVGGCQTLEFLYMQGNFISGPIPSALSSLKGLQELDLSRNNLSGQVPKFLEDLPYLYALNVSFNNFEGELPKNGVFANISASEILGNDKLCGGNTMLNLPPCATQTSSRKHLSPKMIVIISVVSGLASFLMLMFLLATSYWMRKSRRRISSVAHMKDQHIKVSYGELFRATDEFSATNLIGGGSFGSVYKGFLDYDGSRKFVAVKVLNLEVRGASRSFTAECEALRSVRHRNLVKVLTSCSSIDFAGNDFKALVYEFMPNGSLENWLHPEVNETGELKKLSFIQRLNVAIDVASALVYLHHHGETPIIHCDLKPSNVLLDDDMIANVGDFGLARFLVKFAPISSPKPTISTGLKGSVGYIAPEYGGAHPNILLLEMFTGMRPVDDIFVDGLNLHKFVEMAFPERVVDIVDQSLFSQREHGEPTANTRNIDTERERTHDYLVSVLRIGLVCSKESPVERMQMGDVVKEMHTIRDMFIGTGNHAVGRRRAQLREGPHSLTS